MSCGTNSAMVSFHRRTRAVSASPDLAGDSAILPIAGYYPVAAGDEIRKPNDPRKALQSRATPLGVAPVSPKVTFAHVMTSTPRGLSGLAVSADTCACTERGTA